MASRYAWVLNLDADIELGAGANYEPPRRVRAAMTAHARELAKTLLMQGDIVVDEAGEAAYARGFIGRAFCPTPRALRILRRAGAQPEPHPSFDVLRRVNSRAFASAIGPTSLGGAFVDDFDRAAAMLAKAPSIGHAWRVKYAFGMTGRNQRVIVPSSCTAHDVRFVRAGVDGGGVQIEPNVTIADEYCMHGFIAQGGATRLGTVVRQRCDRRGAWVATERIDTTAIAEIVDGVASETRKVAAALIEAGFFGPFGVDAYTYFGQAGELCLQPRSEINARYSMGFAIGFEVRSFESVGGGRCQ